VLAANAPKFTGVVPPDAEALLEELIVYGTPAEARRPPRALARRRRRDARPAPAPGR
jgi:hypothetical protein